VGMVGGGDLLVCLINKTFEMNEAEAANVCLSSPLEFRLYFYLKLLPTV